MTAALVIFDCDGVLVDSEIITNRVFAQMLGELGLEFSLDDVFDRFVGRSMAQLGLTGLATRLEGRRFSVAQVARGKPAPDLFLHAAAHFGVTPSDCVVIEDTPTGVTAGVAAGMTVFGYSARTPAQRLRDAGAHRTFSDMRALPALILGT